VSNLENQSPAKRLEFYKFHAVKILLELPEDQFFELHAFDSRKYRVRIAGKTEPILLFTQYFLNGWTPVSVYHEIQIELLRALVHCFSTGNF
jgi:hypothetical protein